MNTVEQAVQLALDLIGRALSAGEAATVARAWELPGLLVGDTGTMVVSDAAEVETFFQQAIASYRAQGTFQTRPEVVGIDVLSDRLASVDVRWPGFNGEGEEISSETSHYLMRVGDDGSARICAALSRTRTRAVQVTLPT